MGPAHMRVFISLSVPRSWPESLSKALSLAVCPALLSPTWCPAARILQAQCRPRISGKPFSDSGRGRGGAKGSFYSQAMDFYYFLCVTNIPLFPGATECWAWWEMANCELRSCFSYKRWKFIFILVSLCEVRMQRFKWKEISKLLS